MNERLENAFLAAWGHGEEKDGAVEFYLRHAARQALVNYPANDARARLIAIILDAAWYLARLKEENNKNES